jgi:uncharacterized protein (DUF58 family)
MTFSEVRKYEYGDDVRTIDWNVTARNREPYSKVFEEERELTLMLVVDVSPSGIFSTSSQTKIEKSIEIAAILAFSALQNNDKVGLLAFSDEVELFIAPKKGKSHLLRIIRELLVLGDIKRAKTPRGTNLSNAFSGISKYLKKRTIVFVLSDFIDENYERALRIVNKRHDLNAICIYDANEFSLPNLGLVPFKDLESGKTEYVDTSSAELRKTYEKRIQEQRTYFEDTFKKIGAPVMRCELNENHVKKLLGFFKSKT